MPSFRPLHIGTVMQSNLRASMGQGYKNVFQAEGKLLQGSREKQRSRIPKVKFLILLPLFFRTQMKHFSAK